MGYCTAYTGVYSIFSMPLVAAIWFALILLSRADFDFQIQGSSFDCGKGGNLDCSTEAHILPYLSDQWGQLAGPLSLIREDNNSYWRAGSAYFHQAIRLRDDVRAASFNTSFVIGQRDIQEGGGNQTFAADGMAFVLKAGVNGQAPALGDPGMYFGCFDSNDSENSVVVEFDNYYNPEVDTGWNHISIDLKNITNIVAHRNASDASIELWNSTFVYSWVEYRNEDRVLEVRISYSPHRPLEPFLTYRGDLFHSVDEYMWAGFSGGTGGFVSYYYVGNWTFSTSGIAAPRPSTNSAPVLWIAIGVSAGVVFLLFLVFLLVWRRRRYAKVGEERPWYLRTWGSIPSSSSGSSNPLDLSKLPQGCRFTYKQLSDATSGFCSDSKLGEGGFGSVHRGVLPTSGFQIAVKRISRESSQGEKEFSAEVSIISQLRHRNLIQILGWCTDRGKYLIVYELMPHGSLDKALQLGRSAPLNGGILTWQQRFKIVVGTAEGLDYLHQGCRQQVIHRDVKASNILLDEEWNPKLGDFGLARLVDHQQAPATTCVAGTYGYLAPEAMALQKFTDKTDVYAFGAVVLEIVCGRQALNKSLPGEEILVDWVWKCLGEDRLLSVVDDRLGYEYDSTQARKTLALGVLCSHPEPAARPSMRQVVQILAGEAPVPPIPAHKPIITYGNTSSHIEFSDLDEDVESSLKASEPLSELFGR